MSIAYDIVIYNLVPNEKMLKCIIYLLCLRSTRDPTFAESTVNQWNVVESVCDPAQLYDKELVEKITKAFPYLYL